MSRIIEWLGIEFNTTSHKDKLISGLGALVGIACVFFISRAVAGELTATLMLASMGASAVLLFAVPHGTLSQPWPLVGGHLISAFIGVSCQHWLGSSPLAPAVAVGLAVAVMCYARCIHPPGGATALAAVIGGPEVHQLGYWYVAAPVALNVAAILVAALVFNNLFAWRRYPSSLMSASAVKGHTPSLTHEDFAAAMHELDTYVDVSSEELSQIFDKAWAHARRSDSAGLVLRKGYYYSNGETGDQWCIRQVFDADDDLTTDRAKLIYRNVAGVSGAQTVLCTAKEFRQWARFQVIHTNGRWVKVTETPAGN
ncbi:HPP family protein [Gilvimarinus sp. DA14]|uniref:HPP family protein n=1 Tax=Gilvimarinus sp. DA14 TaxID=2956798 RepID=UPI0020B72765|nr:HPP family protein [Gilvimarinus sp. DA14]UTF60389.1 HPP family protein [Gilvimarinus sp. DA14]